MTVAIRRNDEPSALQLLKRILATHPQYTVLEAGGGAQALAVVQSERPDLVLLDLMMPEVDGFAVLETLKANPETRDIPVIVVTAKELTNIEKQRLSGKVQSLMQKGVFSDQDIVDKMVKMLN